MSTKHLRVLILEDSLSDVRLLLRELERSAYEIEHVRVQTAEGLREALESHEWDVILSDYAMPSFDAPEALTIVRTEKGLDIPVIIISGTIGEDVAVEVMKAGATDFFIKHNLKRLIPAIEREVRDAHERRGRRLAEIQLQKAEERFAKAFQASPAGIIITRLADNIVYDVNQRFLDIFGYQQSEVLGKSNAEFMIWSDVEQYEKFRHRLQQGEAFQDVEFQVRRASGEAGYALVTAEFIELNDETYILSFIHDITDRKRADQQIARASERIALLRDIAIAANEAEDIIPVLQFTIDSICAHMEWEIGHAYLSPTIGKGNTLEAISIWHINRENPDFEAFRHFTETKFNPNEKGLIREVLETQQTLWISDVQSASNFMRLEPARQSGLHGAYAFPVMANQEIVGVLEFFSQTINQDVVQEFMEIDAHISTQLGRVIERVYAQTKLRESDERYQALFDRSIDALYIIDFEGQFIDANTAALNLLGYTKAEIPQLTMQMLLKPEYLDVAIRHMQETLMLGFQNKLEEYELQTKDNQSIYVEVLSSVVYQDGQPWAIQGIARDITQRKEVEKQLLDYTMRLEILHGIDQAILMNEEPPIIAQNVLKQLRHLIPFHSANVATYDAQQNEGIFLAVEADEDPIWNVGDIVSTENHPAAEYYLRNEPYIVHDLTAHQGFATPAEAKLVAHGIQSYIGVPLISGERILGALTIRADKPYAFTEWTIAIIREVAAQLAIAIENARLLETERQRNKELNALHRASLQLTRTLDMDVVIDTVLDTAISLIHADNAHIFLYKNGRLSFGAAYWDGKKQSAPLAEPRENGFTYTIVKTNQREIIPDVNQHPVFQDWLWGGAIAGFPLTTSGLVYGVMSIAFNKPHTFDENTIRTLELLSDQAAISIHNTRLYQQIRQHAVELEERVMHRTMELRQQKDRLQIILHNSSDAILLLDQNGVIIQVNQSFCRTFDCEIEEAIGETLPAIANILQADRVEKAIEQALTQQTTQRIELTVQKQNDRLIDFDVMFSPTLNGSATSQEIVCSLHDITARKLTELELRNSLEKEKELNELKLSFSSMVSHEFRTPLTVIRMSAETLISYFDRIDEARRQSKLVNIVQQVERLTKLMDDVLLIGKAEQHMLKCNPTELNLVELCLSIIEEAKTGSSQERQVDFQNDQTCTHRHIDEHLFRHILQNLLSNAFKYSPSETTVEIKLICEDKKTTLIVSDQGIGMPDEFKKNLFQKFHRAKNVGEVHGTGLGLAIVKNAVDEHSGTIDVQSTEGEGTTFTITLPNNP